MGEDLKSSTAMNEFIESVSLVVSNIGSLFSSKFSKLPKKFVQTKNATQNIKHKFYTLSNNSEGERMLKELEKLKLN